MQQNKIVIGSVPTNSKKMQVKTNQLRLLKMMEEIEGYAILLLDSQGNIETWNKGAENIKGYNADEIIGEHFSIFYTKEDQDADLPGRLLSEAAQKGSVYNESWRVRKDKTFFWGSITINALFDESDNVIGYAKITRDLTERKIAEEAAIKHAHELEMKNQELEQFVYIASHDLQEPLLTITNFLELAQEEWREKIDKETKLYFEFITQAAVRMKNLIKGLLDYSRIGIEKKMSLIDCNQLIDEVRHDIDASMQKSGAQIIYHNLPSVNGYPNELKQLFQNLLSNAIKFRKSDASPIINIHAALEGRFWKFSITDNGIGFDLKFKNKIFLIFQRLNNRDIFEGNGIGLAYCKKIVQTHGGEIFADSEPGKGSTFYFTIPSE
ncbi:sensor histidine kinase [Mucilaginibacter gotjawali]|uniref:histidine kinase n=2 Tax=Mucilaginibacter gotjawali TaxID=1550579 RepID=A0A110B5A1_9SPHI|nr:ATP-binding protein [Mucilaginibacter gotjawali]MBB3058773.1 PAS domain S-box-containing protein [Mucilaginibacter gotjawali]BAU53848.1 Phytochrome-like protein cph1 [Mucilaginibacter gotjawali]